MGLSDLAVARPPSWDGRAAVILAHGAGQGMHSPFMNYFHEELAKRGFNVVVYGMTQVRLCVPFRRGNRPESLPVPSGP